MLSTIMSSKKKCNLLLMQLNCCYSFDLSPGMSCCCWICKLLQAARRGNDHIEQLEIISLTPLRTRRQKGDISLDYVRLPEHRQGPIHAYVLYILLCRCTDKRAHISSYLVGMAFYLPASGLLLGLKSKSSIVGNFKLFRFRLWAQKSSNKQ